MKTQLFAAAAVLALAVSAPAFAQNVGSIGAAVNYSDVKATGIDADGTSVKVDGKGMAGRAGAKAPGIAPGAAADQSRARASSPPLGATSSMSFMVW